MYFFFAALVIAIACSAITIKTLVGYSGMKFVWKIVVSAIIVAGWFGTLIIQFVRRIDGIPLPVYAFITHVLYNLTGFVFILFIALMLRDIVWYALYGIAKLFGKDGWHINPSNMSQLNKANLIAVAFSLAISGYALFHGYKIPETREINIVSDKVKGNLRIVQLSDLHINRATPVAKIQQIVSQANLLAPDVIVLTGDTIDDKVTLIEEQLKALKELSAPYGVYSIMGNHEFYNDVYASKRALEAQDLHFLFNGGVAIGNSNVFIAGIPDLNTMYERLNLWRTLYKSSKKQYKVLLSHTPTIADSLSKELIDLVLSGHTHGGQIFPFHLFVKKANSYLAGKYTVNGIDLFVSRGAGTWGPTMRLFAPADIAVINLSGK